jgi:hypothetical protein
VSIVFIACDLFAFLCSKFPCAILCQYHLVLLQVKFSFSEATLRKKQLDLVFFSSKPSCVVILYLLVVLIHLFRIL